MISVQRRGALASLPIDVLLHILEHLKPPRQKQGAVDFRTYRFPTAIAALSRVCKSLRAVCLPHVFMRVSCQNRWRVHEMLDEFEADGSLARHVRYCILGLPEVNEDIAEQYTHEETRTIAWLSYRTLAIFPHLTHLRAYGVPMHDAELLPVTRLRNLRFLDIDWYFPNYVPPDPRAGVSRKSLLSNLPPLETLRISVTRHMAQADTALELICAPPVALNVRWLSLRGPFAFDKTLAQMTFPKLECFAVRDLPFSWEPMTAFFERHSSTLLEVSLDFEDTPSLPSLSAVSRLIRGLPFNDTEKSGLAVNAEDSPWGGFRIGFISYVSKSASRAGLAERGNDITSLKLGFPMESTEEDRWQAVNESLPLEDLGLFFAPFCNLEELTLWTSGAFELVFSTFMQTLGSICSTQLPRLRKVGVAWYTREFLLDRHSSENDIFLDCPTSEDESESDSDSDDDSLDSSLRAGEEELDHSPFSRLYNRETASERLARRWQRWEARHYPGTERIMRAFLNRCPSVQVVDWHLNVAWDRIKTPCWTWRRCQARLAPSGQLPPSNSDMLQKVLGKRRVRALEARETFVVGDLAFPEGVREPRDFFIANGREAEYLDLHNSTTHLRLEE